MWPKASYREHFTDGIQITMGLQGGMAEDQIRTAQLSRAHTKGSILV